MDLGTILTATILLSICILPFILMNRKKKKRMKQLYQNFILYISEKNLKIGQYDICGDFVIGTDNTSKYFLFFKQNQTTSFKKCIPVEQIISCQLEKIYDIDSNSTAPSNSLDRILLVFEVKENNTVNNNTLILFDSNDQMQLDGELQIGQKWSNILKTSI